MTDERLNRHYREAWDWDVEKHTPATQLEDWEAYDRLKERIREIYPPGEDERKIQQLLEVVRM